jgi:hypothetical protein
LTILKAAPTVTVIGGTFVYDGEEHHATGSVTGVIGEVLGTPTFTYSYIDDDGETVVLPGAPVEPGIYTVVASFAGNTNYEEASASATIRIVFEDLQAIVEELNTAVDELVTTGNVNSGQGRALFLNLQGDEEDIDKVQAFLNKIQGFVNGGILSADDAELLLELGNQLLQSLLNE